VREGRNFAGVDAVIDKDLASARLAREVGVDIFIIATDVNGAALHYGTEQERFLTRLTVAEAEQHLNADHFPDGSMRPKIEACKQLIDSGIRRAAIAHLTDIEKAVAGQAGTQFRA